MNKLAIIFVGQGSQYPGMGCDLLPAFLKLQPLVFQASKMLGYDVINALNQKEDWLKQTKYTQPLLLFASLIAYEALLTLKPQISALAGFSLGEYGAYYGAKVLDFDQTMRIIAFRAQVMEECALKNPGTMVAVLGGNRSIIEEVAAMHAVFPANYNSPSQMVVSGENDKIVHFTEAILKQGAKRVVPLNVSGAFHSPLMTEAKNQLATYLQNETVNPPVVPVYVNTTGKPLIAFSTQTTMARQVSSPVLFIEMINQMSQDGITHLLEVGPGTVLSGLINKINPQLQVSHFGKLADWDYNKGWLQEYGFIK